MVLIDQARKIVSDQSELERAADTIYALDSTTFELKPSTVRRSMQ